MSEEKEIVVEDNAPKKEKKDRKDIVKNVAIVFLSIMLILTFFSNTIMNYSLPQVATTYVERGEINPQIKGTGDVSAEDPYNVTVKESRKISGVAVKEGAHVNKDDILFYLDDMESDELVKEKENLDALELQYEQALFSGDIPDEVITKVRKGKKSTYDNYQAEVKSVTDKYNAALAADNAAQAKIDEITGKKDYDAAGNSYNAATPEYTIAQLDADIASLNTEIESKQAEKDSEEDTDEQEKIQDKIDDLNSKKSALENKKAELSKDKSQLENYGGQVDASNSQKLAIATAEKTKTAAALKVAEEEKTKVLGSVKTEIALNDLKDKISTSKEKLSKLEAEATGATIKSPVDGIVSSIAKVAGETTSAEEPVAVIQVDGKDMTVEFSVPTEQAKKLKVGDAAKPQNPYQFKEEFRAILKSIKNDKTDPAGKKVLTFKVESSEVTPGQSLSLQIGERSKEYDMVVPNNAVKGGSSDKHVLVIKEKHSPLGNRYIATRVDVEVVAQDDKNTAINASLDEYAYVITTASKAVNPGDQVRLSDEGR